MTPFVPFRLPPQDGTVTKERRRHSLISKEFTDHCSIHINEKLCEVYRNK